MTQEKLLMKALSMDIITAKMFTELDTSITKAFGKHGQELIFKGLEAYGLKDAELLAIKATAEGENHTFYNYLPFEIDGPIQYSELTPFARFSKMFAYIAKEVVDFYGEDGQLAVKDAVRIYGEKRGSGIAQRARTNGLPNSVENYLNNYDMGRSDLFKIDTTYKENAIEQTFRHCPLGQQWADDNMHEYGILYCQSIDPAVAYGYNNNFEVIHDEYVLKEGQCHFIFQMKEKQS